MSHSSSERSRISTNADDGKRSGSRWFVFGWLLTIFNLLGAAWAIYVPITLNLYQRDVFFTVDTAVTYGFQLSLTIATVGFIALLEMLFLHRIARRMVHDVPEVAAAEAALKLARFTAVFTLAVCIVSLFLCVKLCRSWSDYIRIMT
ncbi:MAG TPA: hypothetical protein VFG65_03825 [Fimbriimonadales bacterium]|jgi:hypothetical protein|nr:hypothetical protein [Fimbriimonadales bacterium]